MEIVNPYSAKHKWVFCKSRIPRKLIKVYKQDGIYEAVVLHSTNH